MNNISFDLTGRLEPIVVDLYRAFDRVASALGLPYLLVGATVRDMVMQITYGIETPTKTLDIDFGVMLESWDQFARLKSALVHTGEFAADPREQQRLLFRRAVKLDVVPFGNLAVDDMIVWPPDNAVRMNAVGYQDAYHAAWQVTIADELSIRIASIPTLVMLKLFAWNDRPAERAKDVQDVRFLLLKYLDADNERRVFDEPGDLYRMFEQPNGRSALSARLLGRDLRRTTSVATIDALLSVLVSDGVPDTHLLDAMAIVERQRLDDEDDPYERSKMLMDNFIAGVREG